MCVELTAPLQLDGFFQRFGVTGKTCRRKVVQLLRELGEESGEAGDEAERDQRGLSATPRHTLCVPQASRLPEWT